MSAITKVWVRRPNSSPTRIQIPSSVSTPILGSSSGDPGQAHDTPRHVDVELTEDFLVDDLREVILKKYPQSLGKHHDAADLAIQIPKRHQEGQTEVEGGRLLAPEESVLKVLTDEYPNGQKSVDAWTIITTGGRDNYTRWWLQTGGLSTEYPVRPAFSPNQYISSAGGSFGSEYHQEYFPYIPQTGITPPGEFPPRSRASGTTMMSVSQYPRSQARPPLRPGRTAPPEQMFPPRRYNDATVSSSMVAEPPSGPESEHSQQQGRNSPDTNMSHVRYPASVRSNNSVAGRNTPPGEYNPNRMRQGTVGYKQIPTSAAGQSFQMQLPSQSHPTLSQNVHSPLGGPPIVAQPRLSAGSAAHSTISSSPNPPTEKPPQQKGGTSPKSPISGNSSNNGSTHSPTTRRKSNTISGQNPMHTTLPQSPSAGVEHAESPRGRTNLPLVQSKEKDPVATNKTSAIGVIPPINVLIVEDNIINAQILEVFFRKRKLKYATAVNGKEAVEKWRQGGWHLVLMDIQLPVMSGIEATKEIRRLERVNHIGVFTDQERPLPEDELGDLPFPSPVIIVALTASSRESDRNEALAAGCNDFLTKPVGAPWLERKAIEWGCMQALIYTSFERRKRHADAAQRAKDDGVQVPVEKQMLGETSKKEKKFKEDVKKDEDTPKPGDAAQVEPEKPPVQRNESEDSVQTHTSESTDEDQNAT